jgi:hypothetical protein
VYSFGILLWEMCATEKPFHGYSSGKHMKHVVLGGERPKMDAAHTSNWPLHLQWLMKRCWSAFPSQRPTFDLVKQTLVDVIASLEAPGSEKKAVEVKSPPAGGFAAMKMAPRATRAQTVSHAGSSSISSMAPRAARAQTLSHAGSSSPQPPEKSFAAFKKPPRIRGQTTTAAVTTPMAKCDGQEMDEKGSGGWKLRRTRAASIDA